MLRLAAFATAAAAAAPCPPVGLEAAAPNFDLTAHAVKKGWAVRRNVQGFEEIDLPLKTVLWDGTLSASNLTLVTIPGGSFYMGSSPGKGDRNEQPKHVVDMSEYRIAKTPITKGHFAAFEKATNYKSDMARGLRGDCEGCFIYPSSDWTRYLKGLPKDAIPCGQDAGNGGHGGKCCRCDAWEPKRGAKWDQTSSGFVKRDDIAVSCTSWNDGNAFGEWAAKELDLPHLVLPSEAQWMKAALGAKDDERQYPWGDDMPKGTHCNFADASFVKQYGRARPCNEKEDDGWGGMAPVGQYPAGASPYGVLDLTGQGHEWAFDWMSDNYYKNSPSCNPLGPSPTASKAPRGADGKVNLGGAWNSDEGYKNGKWQGGDNLRTRSREGDEPDSADDHSAFRVVFDPQRPANTIGLRATGC